MNTAKSVRAELPPVKIMYNGILFWGRVSGRLNDFATVSPYDRVDGKNKVFLMGPCFEFSWETIAYSLNTSIPLSTE